MSTEYALTSQRDEGDSHIPLQDRLPSHLTDHDASVSRYVTPETSLGHQAPGESTGALHRSALSDGSPTKKTLQIRHSDSFDGSSYADSSEDSERDDVPTEEGRSQTKRNATVSAMPLEDYSSAGLDRLDDGERGVQNEADYLATGASEGSTRTADQAGAILGIANV